MASPCRPEIELVVSAHPDTAPSPPPLQRVHYMDAMRGVLMSMGVLLHTALIYEPAGSWIVASERPSRALRVLADFLTSFRMPAFFMISGYFCLQTLRRHGRSRFLRTRSQRILVPLLAAAILINVPQKWFLPGQPDWGRFLATGEWRYHLWFLVNVMVYFLCAWALYGVAVRRGWRGERLYAIADRAPLSALVLLAPLVSLVLLAANRMVRMDGVHLGMFQPYWLMHYGQYFAFGLLLNARPAFLARFSSARAGHVMALALCFAAQELLPSPDTLAQKALTAYVRGATTWLGCICCFTLFVRFANRPVRSLRFLSDASYTTYLFHHPLVVAGGFLLVRWDTPAWIGFPAVVVATAAACLVLHALVVRRSRPVRFLFNGK